jgi:hypothetical protein
LEFIDFQGKRWVVISKVEGRLVDDHTKLKKNYGCDLVIKNNQNIFFILNEVIDAEFKEI